MSMGDSRCSSCGLTLSGRGSTHFVCPDCGTTSIGRCFRCRDQSVGYTCPKCAFDGP